MLIDGFDPLKYGQEILVVILAIICLSIVYVYWNRFVFLLTGDERIHCSSLDCIYSGCLKCCGVCSGEWTRCLTRCPCCPRRIRGKNLIKEIGRCFGWATVSVEIKNITVGDLPFDNGRGDFYLSIDAATNPAIVTALQEEKLPKVVHFPEIISLKIRDSPLEPRVKITVRDLDVVGHNDICDLHLDSTFICDIVREDRLETRVKRFQMRSCDNSIERETPPWILLEFSESDDVRGVDHMPNAFNNTLNVRTWVPTDHSSVRDSGDHSKFHHDPDLSHQIRSENDKWTKGVRQNVDLGVGGFKTTYHLLDDSGNPVAEPAEEALAHIRCMRTCAMMIFLSFQCLVWIAIFVYGGFRFYVWSCWRQFKGLTIAELRGATFPISHSNLDIYEEDCHDRFSGTGLSTNGDAEGNALANACRPDSDQIIQVCQNVPYGQPRPQAFNQLLHDAFNVETKTNIKCFDGVCKARELIAPYDWYVGIGAIGLFLCTFLLRFTMNWCIRQQRKQYQKADKDSQDKRVRGRRG